MASSWIFTAVMLAVALVVLVVVALALAGTNHRPQAVPPAPSEPQQAVLTRYQSEFRKEEVRKTMLQNEAREVSETVNGWLEYQAK
jgi:uncharacterized membrane protein